MLSSQQEIFKLLFSQIDEIASGSSYKTGSAILETTAGHWPFSNQFQHLADQNPFWSAKFTVHFQWKAINNLQNIPFSKKWLTNI